LLVNQNHQLNEGIQDKQNHLLDQFVIPRLGKKGMPIFLRLLPLTVSIKSHLTWPNAYLIDFFGNKIYNPTQVDILT
jgi:hypothetical protein